MDNDLRGDGSRQSNTMLIENAMESSIAGMAMVDMDLNMIYANKRASEIFGYDNPQYLIGRNIRERWGPRERMEMALEAIRTEGKWNGEISAIHKNGSSMDLLVYASLVRGTRDDPEGIFASFVDITEKKELERRLEAEMERQRLLLDNVNAHIWYVTEPETYGAMNRPLADFLGLTREQVEKHSIMDLRGREAAEICIAGNRKVFEEKVTIKTEEEVRGADGRLHIMDTTKVPVLNEKGEVEYAVCTAIDITEKRRAEALSARLGRIMDKSVNEIYLFDGETLKFVQSNKAALMNLGYSMDQLMEMTSLDLKPDMAPEEFMGLLSLLEHGVKEEIVFETVHRRKDGTKYDVEVHLQAMRDEGHPMYMAVIVDITDWKRMTEALNMANKKIELIGKATRHDLLNSLSVIKGYAGFMMTKTGDETLLRHLGIIEKATGKMEQQLIFQKEYEQMGTKQPIWMELKGLVEGVTAELPMGEVRVSIECQDLELFCDPMMEKVLYNLTQNTLRHGGEVSQIRISCERLEEGMVLTFQDDGVGIPPEEKEKIFEYGFGKGMGYGLFLVREMLAVDGISIIENGEEGAGARFEILFPPSRYRFSGKDQALSH